MLLKLNTDATLGDKLLRIFRRLLRDGHRHFLGLILPKNRVVPPKPWGGWPGVPPGRKRNSGGCCHEQATPGVFFASVVPTLCLCFLLAITACTKQTAAPLSPFPSEASFAVGFSPKGQSLDIILDAIGGAEQSILVAAYSFTSKPIATALLAAHKRGVVVRVVADAKSSGGRYSAVTFLANRGVPIRANGRYAIFHHKFMVIDGRHLETGSFNYSAAAAEKNAENVLLLRNAPELAGVYMREWERLWSESEEIKARY